MSEYQYYEFLATDRHLTSEEMSDLRSISSRAQITPVSFSNYYNFGNFKGDPDDLMQHYFDAHVYTANWMTAIFKLRLPNEVMSEEADSFLAEAEGDVLDFKTTKTHTVITWSLHDSKNYSRFEIEDGEGWMARLAPIRDELLRGDLKDLSNNFPKAWEQIQHTLNRGSGLAYDEACQALLDLSEAYALVDRSKSFELKLEEFMTAHQRRKAFVERLRRAKLWREK